ncbi:PREDICTED: formin-like protein 3 [Populus euphratica]|uniref:Formin-like protein n=1 Tax=Populus euphratica TaxID=75702 RepID=A0AAJ6T205_POPEU|nr:PREDICTED: formin-like protein 3 [Populus euphratica]
MELRRLRAGYAIVYVILLCTLAMGSIEGKRRADMLFGNCDPELKEKMVVWLANLCFGSKVQKQIVANVLVVAGDKEEQAWIHCWKELVDRNGSFEDFDLDMLQEANFELKSRLLTKENIDKSLSVLSPKMKQELLDYCLREKNLHFSYHGDSSRHSFIECVKFLLHLCNSHRGYLASNTHRQTKPSLTPSAPAAASPGYGSAPFNLAAVSSSSPRRLTLSFFEKKLYRLQDMSDSPPPPSPGKHSPPSSHFHKQVPPPPVHKGVDQNLIVAVAATAAGTFCFVATLFICWCCCKEHFVSLRRSSFAGAVVGVVATKLALEVEKEMRGLFCTSICLIVMHFQDPGLSLIHCNSYFLKNVLIMSQLYLLFSATSQSSFSLGNSSSKEHSSNSGNTTFQSNLSTKYGNHDSSLADAPSVEAHAGEALPPLKPPPGRTPAPPPPRPPPPPPPPVAAPRPPVPPKVGRAPPVPPSKGKLKPSPLGPHRENPSEGDDLDSEEAPKAKLKPFFWDKVVANPDHSMVWDEISSGSFQFSEEMIESLFGYNSVDNNKNDRKRDPSEPSIQYIQIINPRKAQNLSILLRALNVTTEEVLNALQEGNELPVELLQTLLKMAPTSEEELKLRLYADDISQLGPAERFLKVLVEIPFAFRRIEALIFMSALREEVSGLKESFATLEVACNKLRNSRLFLKLLEAVLKTGNRMNDGTYRGGAQAFKLDTLLKLSDVKGIDGKTTLLHFVVQEIIRSEGIRAVRTARPSLSFSSVKSDEYIDNANPASAEHYRNLGLQVVSGLSTELEDVRKAAIIDANVLTSTVSKLNQSLTKTKAFLDSDLKSLGEDGEFYHALASFLERAESEMSSMSEEERRITALVKSTADYFHGNAGMDEGLRLFTIVRDFLIMIDKTCKEVRDDRAKRPITTTKKEVREVKATNSQKPENAIQKLFPAIVGRRADDSSSDDESPSP